MPKSSNISRPSIKRLNFLFLFCWIHKARKSGQETYPIDLNLQSGTIVSISARGPVDVEESSIHIDYADLLEAVNVGDKITVDNGLT